MKKERDSKNKRPQQSGSSMPVQMQASVGIQSFVSTSHKRSEKGYECLFICEPEIKAREGKMAYVRPEYHEHIIRITRVIGRGSLSLSVYIDHVLMQHFNQCEEVIESLYARSYNPVF